MECLPQPTATTATTTAISSTMETSTGVTSISPRRFKIYFQDDAVCQRSRETVQQLLTSAMADETTSSNATSTSNSALLAKKALKYRKVYERMAGVDVHAPEFDASRFLGVSWCKTTSLKAHCSQRQH